MIDFLQNIDTVLFTMLHQVRTSALDQAVYAFSGKWVWVPMYVVIAMLVVRRWGWRVGLAFIVGTGLAVAIADQTCASLIRPLVERLRPTHPDNPLSASVNIVNDYRGGSYGFPSCHAANSFAFATFMSLAFPHKRAAVAMFLWAIAQCWSRIYLGVHYPGDLLVGAALGAAIGWATYRVTHRLLIDSIRRAAASGSTTIRIPLPIVNSRKVHIADMLIMAMLATTIAIAIAYIRL